MKGICVSTAATRSLHSGMVRYSFGPSVIPFMKISEMLFVGVKGQVIAFTKVDGSVLWKAALKTGFFSSAADFVTVLVEGNRVYAHTSGQLFCLDAATGQQLWKNGLDGLGYGIASLAIESASAPSPQVVAKFIQRQQESGSSSSNASD